MQAYNIPMLELVALAGFALRNSRSTDLGLPTAIRTPILPTAMQQDIWSNYLQGQFVQTGPPNVILTADKHMNRAAKRQARLR